MPLFYGWKLSFLSMGGNFLLQGSALYCMNAFMEPLCSVNGWSRMGVNFSLGFAALMGQLAMPIAAAVSVKISLRLLMGLGALIGGLSTIAMGLTSNIYLFTVFLTNLWISSQFCGGVAGNALMSNWFSHFRGMAFGVANSGVSLSGIFLPMLVLIIINNFSLLTAYCILGLLTCSLAPLCWRLVRRTPGMMDMHPDGRRHEPRKMAKVQMNTSMQTLLHRPAVWCIGLSYGLALMCASGIISQLKPRFADAGLPDYTAMFIAASASIAATLAKYLWGWICDKISPIRASQGLMLICLISMIFVFLPQNIWLMLGFSLSFSLATGGLWVVLPAVTAYYFGSLNFLGVYKVISIFIIIRCIGFPVMGISHDLGGNYLLADIIFTMALSTAFLLTLFIKQDKAMENFHANHRSHRLSR